MIFIEHPRPQNIIIRFLWNLKECQTGFAIKQSVACARNAASDDGNDKAMSQPIREQLSTNGSARFAAGRFPCVPSACAQLPVDPVVVPVCSVRYSPCELPHTIPQIHNHRSHTLIILLLNDHTTKSQSVGREQEYTPIYAAIGLDST